MKSQSHHVSHRPLQAPVRLPRRVWWPAVLRWQLRGLQARAALLEQALADEFALTETAPLHDELAALRRACASIERRLAPQR